MKLLDIIIEEYSSIVLYTPVTAIGRLWIREKLERESWQRFGDSLAVERKYANDITQALEESTLVVSRQGHFVR